MSDNLSISSPQTTTYSTSIQDGHRQDDVSTDEGLQSTASVQPTPLLKTAPNISASLKDGYNSSAAQLDEPQLTSITAQDITELSSLAQNLSESSTASETSTSAANPTAASQILEIIDLYLQFEKDKDDEYYNPGAPNAAETTDYQQELDSSTQSQIPSHVASTALSTRYSVSSMNSGLNPQREEMGQTEEGTNAHGLNTNKQEKLLIHHVHSTTREEGSRLGQIAELLKPGVDLRNIGRNNHPLTHHKNPVTGTRANIVGRDSRHNVMRKGLEVYAIHNKEVLPTPEPTPEPTPTPAPTPTPTPTPEPAKPLSTATYSNEESLDALRASILDVGRLNVLSILNDMNVNTSKNRSGQVKIMLSRDAGIILALQKSIGTLKEVTSKPRPQALTV
ncbi:MAG: hypothetical protein ACOYK6_06655 [Chthoniobacterales bacterium]